MRAPSSQISPASGRRRPTRCLIVTDFPTPDVPMMNRTSPFSTRSVRPRRTALPVKDLEIFRKSIIESSHLKKKVTGARKKEVEHDHDERRSNDRARRGAPDA